MKKIISVLCIILACSFCFSSCGKDNPSDLWSDALYQENTSIGSGDVTVTIDVTAGDKTVVFTVNTNAKTLGDALTENKLVSGDNGAYGLYIKSVNGIEADYDKNGAYWSVTKDGEYLSSGVDSINISDGDHYELTYTKA